MTKEKNEGLYDFHSFYCVYIHTHVIFIVCFTYAIVIACLYKNYHENTIQKVGWRRVVKSVSQSRNTHLQGAVKVAQG